MPCNFKQFSFFFRCRPQPKARPRARRRGVFLSIYQEISDFEKGLAGHCRWTKSIPKGIECAVKVEFVFVFLCPSGVPKWKKWKATKPDCDNLVKAVLDAMTLLGFWVDDSQVCSLAVDKVYMDVAGPGVSVRVSNLTRQPIPA